MYLFPPRNKVMLVAIDGNGDYEQYVSLFTDNLRDYFIANELFNRNKEIYI